MRGLLSLVPAHTLRLPRWSSEQARSVLAALAASGLSVAQFAREHDLDPQRLFAWRRKLAASAPAPTPSAASVHFVELAPGLPSTTATPAPAARYEVQLSNGERLRVEGAFEVDSVRALLALLREGARPC